MTLTTADRRPTLDDTLDLSALLAEHAVDTTADALDGHTAGHLKANLLDVLAVAIGGVGTTGLPELREFLRQTSAPGAGVVVGTADRLAAPGAAFANAASAHALEWDDALDAGGGMHAGPSVHFSALAIADVLGGVDGRDYLAATAIGLDVAARLALATTADFGWHRASVFSVFGATVAATRLLHLDATATRHALGLAFSQASGSRQAIRDGSLTTRLHTGFAARNAVTAALLAQVGFTAATEIFDGPDGFVSLYQREQFDRSVALEGLGTQLLSSRISTKPFPGGRYVHAFVEAAVDLGSWGPDGTVERVVVHTPSGFPQFGDGRYPTDYRATYDLQYSVALAVATNSAPVRLFVDPGDAPAEVRRVFDLLTVVGDAPDGSLGILEVHGRNGRSVRREVVEASGSPENPLSRAALLAKVWELHDFAGHTVPRTSLERVVELVDHLESLPSTTQLTELLSTR